MKNDWKQTLKKLETEKKWGPAIELMQKIIGLEPNNMEAHLAINYLLMNLLVEEDYHKDKHNYYADLLLHHFIESYQIFYDNAEYLYYTGRIACMSEWYFNIELEDANSMLLKAAIIDPNNLVYKWTNISKLSASDPLQTKVIKYAKLVLQENSPIKNELVSKGSLGEYILGMMTYWSKEVLSGKNPYK